MWLEITLCLRNWSEILSTCRKFSEPSSCPLHHAGADLFHGSELRFSPLTLEQHCAPYWCLNISFCSAASCATMRGRVQEKLSTGQRWAWETRACCARGTIPRPLCVFPYIHFHSWGHPCPEICRIMFPSAGPVCALISHSGRTLPRHIWLLVRLIMSNNIYGSAHPSRAPFMRLDLAPGHESLADGKKRLLCTVALRRWDWKECVQRPGFTCWKGKGKVSLILFCVCSRKFTFSSIYNVDTIILQ